MRFSRRTAAIVVTAVIVVSVVMGYGVTKLTTKVDYEEFLPEKFPSVKTLAEFEQKFPTTSQALLLIESENVVKAGAVKKILQLENAILEDPVIKPVLVQITSFTTYVVDPILENTGGVLPPDPQLEAAIQQALAQPEVSGMVVGKYITEDQKAALLVVSILGTIPQENKNKVANRIESYAENFEDENFSVGITGDAVLYRDIHNMMNEDNRVLIPAAIVLVTVIIFLIFRRVSDIPLSLILVGIGTLWTVGLMGYLGIEFTTIHVAVVPLLLGLGVDYAVHFLNRYYEECERGEKTLEATSTAIGTVGTAIAIAAITTIIGFGSFMVSDLPPVQTLGEFVAIGVALMFVLSVTFLPALVILRDRNRSKGAQRIRGKKLKGALAAVAIGAERHWKPILVVVILITGASVVAASGISSSMSFETFLPSDIESVSTLHQVENKFGGQSAILLLAQGGTTSPAGLGDMLRLENEIRLGENNWLDENNGGLITGSQSIADLIFYAAGGSVPTDQQTVSLVIENLDESQRSVLLSSDNTAAIYFMINAQTDKEMKEATRIVRNHVRSYSGVLDLNINGDPAVTGEPVIISDIMDTVMSGMMNSTVLTVLLCLIVLVILFRSPVLGVLGMVPLLFAMSWEFGTMRGLGWSLDVLSMGISALIIGLGIDYAVHIIHRFREEKRKDPEQILKRTLSSVGVPITVGAATTVGVFGVLSLSRMPAMARFGQLTAMVIIFAYVVALVALPAILVMIGKRQKR